MGENVREHNLLKGKIQNMPIKRTMVLFVVTALLLAAVTSLATIMGTYSLRIKQFDLGNYDSVDTINTVLYVMIFVYVIGFIVAAVYMFYHVKLREPIKQLMGGTTMIAQNNLNFKMDYTSKDELGQVCASFEKMKTELRHSNANMWRMAEDRKKLNAVFAHDLRTPLTVLKGYTDFFEEYIPSEQMQPDKLLQTTGLMSMHIERIENYVNMMAKIQRVEDTPVSPQPVTGKAVNDLLKETVDNLEKQTEISILFKSTLQLATLYLDADTAQRVLENLLANAVRYARSKIVVSVYCQDIHLVVSVTDDGSGFLQEYLDRPFTPFYQADKPEHFGLGLNICKTLCQKHSGALKIVNIPDGGAKVSAFFKIR